jgi:hypothetical protein
LLLRSAEIQPLFIDLPLSSPPHTTLYLSLLHYQTKPTPACRSLLAVSVAVAGVYLSPYAERSPNRFYFSGWYPRCLPQSLCGLYFSPSAWVSWFRKPALPQNCGASPRNSRVGRQHVTTKCRSILVPQNSPAKCAGPAKPAPQKLRGQAPQFRNAPLANWRK